VLGPGPLRSSFRVPEAMDIEAVKRNGYHDQQILVVSLKDYRLTWDQREMLKQVGDKIYGKAPARSGNG
jgi:hypothetical protein